MRPSLYLVDAQLPPALVQKLRIVGIDAVHVNGLGLLGASDEGIWAKAIDLRAVIITKDQDFVALARSRKNGPPVVHLRLGNTSNNELWERFEAALDHIRTCVSRGDAVIEISR